MEVDSLVAAVAWAVTLWKLPAMRRNWSRDKRIPRIWAFVLFLACSMTFQVDAVYVAVNAFVGVNNLAWLAAYVFLVLAFYFFATATHVTMRVQPPRWMRPYLMATLGLFAAIFPIGVATGPEWPSHDIPRTLWDLAFMETLYVFAVVMCFTPTLAFVRLIRSETVLPTRIRESLNLLALVLVLTILTAKSVIALLGFFDPFSPFVSFVALLTKALLGVAGLVWSLAFVPQRLYLALARPFAFWQKVRTLRDLKQLQTRLDQLFPPVAPVSVGRWDQLRNLDFHIYRTVISILDGRRMLADYLNVPSAGSGQALEGKRQSAALTIPSAEFIPSGAEGLSAGLEAHLGIDLRSGVMSPEAWDSATRRRAKSLHQLLQGTGGEAGYEELVAAYRRIGRMLHQMPASEQRSTGAREQGSTGDKERGRRGEGEKSPPHPLTPSPPHLCSAAQNGEQVARWLSRIFHPFVVTVPTLALATYLTGASLLSAVGWTALSVATVTVPTAIFLAVNVRTGRYSDWDVSVRAQRHSIYLVGGICLVALLAVLALTGAPDIIAACIYAAILTSAVGAAINYFLTKVSLHAATMAGCTAVLASVSAPIGAGLGLATLAVGWSRMRLNHHTLTQVILGWIIGATCTLIVFHLYLSP